MGGCQNHGRVFIFRSAADGRALHLGCGCCAFQECEFAAQPGEEGTGQGSPTLWELGMCQGCCLKGQRLKKLRRKLQE